MNQNNSLAVAEQSCAFPVATTAKERFVLDGNATWSRQRKALGITKDTPKDDVKKAQAEFMTAKRAACKQARAIGSALVSNGEFGIKLTTWSRRGVRQFKVEGKETDEEDSKDQRSVQAAIAAHNEGIRGKMLASGLTEEQVSAILSGNN